MTRSARILAVMLAAALGVTTLGSCSDDGDGDAGTTTVAESSSTGTGEAGDPASDTTAADATATCTTEQTGPLRIVLVNDDGVANPAIDVLIERFDDHDAFDLEMVAREASYVLDTRRCATGPGVEHL